MSWPPAFSNHPIVLPTVNTGHQGCIPDRKCSQLWPRLRRFLPEATQHTAANRTLTNSCTGIVWKSPHSTHVSSRIAVALWVQNALPSTTPCKVHGTRPFHLSENSSCSGCIASLRSDYKELEWGALVYVFEFLSGFGG